METREILQDIIDGFSLDKFARFFREKNREGIKGTVVQEVPGEQQHFKLIGTGRNKFGR